jgi:hypothetical protein
MPAADVEFVVDAVQDASYAYAVATRATMNGADVDEQVAKVTPSTTSAVAGTEVSVEVAAMAGYELADVVAVDATGGAVVLTRAASSVTEGGFTFTFVMPAASVDFTVTVVAVGAEATTRATSLAVDTGAVHALQTNEAYRTGTLMYSTIVFSGSAFGADKYYMTSELESFNYPEMYQQTYSTSDGLHEYTGLVLSDLITYLGASGLTDDTPVVIECADGTVAEFSWNQIYSLAYNAYDANDYSVARGVPVVLAFGADGVPNTDGAISVVGGSYKTADGEGFTFPTLGHVTRIAVGDNIDYSQHVWGQYTDYSNVRGTSAVTIRVTQGGEVLSEMAFSYNQIEALARENVDLRQAGQFTTRIYESDQTSYSGAYTDYYEGYDLYSLLVAAGVPYAPDANVQFYQNDGTRTDDWKTVNVSLGYIAGNGAGGVGDYSDYVVDYASTEDSATVSAADGIYGVRPMIAYGKAGLPLCCSSGSAGVVSGMYNYRGPLIAILPQNATEGGTYVGTSTSAACYLSTIEVELPQDFVETNPGNGDGDDTIGSLDDFATEFLGGSLRMDCMNADESIDVSKTSLRMGYKVTLPAGVKAEDCTWYWEYGLDADSLIYTRSGKAYAEGDNGSFVTNLVFTGIGSSNFGKELYSRLTVSFTSGGKVYTTTSDVDARSVNDVAEKILASKTATQAEKDYAALLAPQVALVPQSATTRNKEQL